MIPIELVYAGWRGILLSPASFSKPWRLDSQRLFIRLSNFSIFPLNEKIIPVLYG